MVEVTEYVWAPSAELMEVHPQGALPVLVDSALVGTHHYMICEYLEEMYPGKTLLGESPARRAEVRRLMAWFDEVFYREVYLAVFYEKLLKSRLYRQSPDMRRIKQGLNTCEEFMEAIDQLADTHSFLAGKWFSWADISGAAHLSCLDYLGHINWQAFPAAKEWYSKIKSRPAFRPFLKQAFLNIPPSAHYANLDF